jgi:hypothetical protein
LIFNAVVKHDGGHYKCVARNRGGEDSFTVNLNITRRYRQRSKMCQFSPVIYHKFQLITVGYLTTKSWPCADLCH